MDSADAVFLLIDSLHATHQKSIPISASSTTNQSEQAQKGQVNLEVKVSGRCNI